MNRACLLLTAGLVAGIFAAGNAAATSDSDQRGESHPGWRMVNAGEGRKVPVRTYESWSRAYARAQGGEASSNSGHGYAAHRAGWGYPGWGYGGYGTDLVDAASGLLTLGVLPVAEPVRSWLRLSWDSIRVRVRPDVLGPRGRLCASPRALPMNRRRWGKLSKKLIDFFDKSLLQHFDFERFLIVRTIPFERKALRADHPGVFEPEKLQGLLWPCFPRLIKLPPAITSARFERERRSRRPRLL